MRLATCLFTSLFLLAACGERPSEPATPDVSLETMVMELSIIGDRPDLQEKVLNDIEERGRRDVPAAVAELLELLKRERRVPGREVIEFRVDYSGTGLRRDDTLADLNAVRDVLIRRLKMHYPDFGTTLDVVGVDEAGIGRIQMKVLYALEKSPEDVRPFVERLTQIGSRRGTFGLRLVVERPGEDRPSLFEGSAEQYDKLLLSLREALKAETQADRNRPVGTPPYLLHLAPPTKAGGPPTDLLLQVPSTLAGRFDQRDLELSGFMDREKQRHVLRFALSKKRQSDWAAFCEAHAGRAYALIVNGVVQVTAAVPSDAAKAEYLLDMGDLRDRTVEGNIRAILKDTTPGWYTRPVEATILPNEPDAVDTPVAMALAMLGEEAEPLLGRFMQETENPALRKRAQWAREQIARRLTGQPMKKPEPGK
jgi:hypothetical protein